MLYKKTNLLLSLIIIPLVALLQLNETIYAVALPKIAISLDADKALVQYTIISFFIGVASGMLLWGSLSDKIGKKLTLSLGLSVYVTASLICWLSNCIEQLIIMRFIQGVGVSVSSVLGQAIARDFIQPENRKDAFAKINIALSFVPALGLVIGNFITQNLVWSAVFIPLIIVGVVIAANNLLFMPKIKLQVRKNLFKDCFLQIINDNRGLKLGFFVGANMGILCGYFAESTFFFIDALAVSPTIYGFIALSISIPLFVGGLIAKKITYSSNQIIYLGIKLLLTASISFYVLAYFDVIALKAKYVSLFISISCIYLVLMSISMIIPNCLSQILEKYGRYTGTAASIFGFYYYITTAIFIALMSSLHAGNIKDLPLFFMLSSAAILIVYKYRKPTFRKKKCSKIEIKGCYESR